MLVLDSRGLVTQCSSAAASILGRPAVAMIGQPVTRWLTDLPFRTNMPEFNLAFVRRGGRGSVLCHPVSRWDGLRVWAEVFPGGIDGIDKRSIVVIVKRSIPLQPPRAAIPRSTPQLNEIGA